MKSKKKALIIVTSHDKLGNTGQQTGYYLPEVTHPYLELTKAGFEVEIVSPRGGKAPMDERSREPIADRELESKLDRTLAPSEIRAEEFSAILFAGGHGTMWDFPQDERLAAIAAAIYERGGVVAAVCHGPAALVGIRLSNGKFLVDGKSVTGFSNAEEDAAGLTDVMPFLLESKLVERGASYSKAPLWQNHVVVSERLVTGQNPASAAGVGAAVARLLSREKGSAISKVLLAAFTLGLTAMTVQAEAAPYYRFWRGFKLPAMSYSQFATGINETFIPRTARIAEVGGLVSYLPVLTAQPETKPTFVPDELALVAYESQEAYKKYRATPEGQQYSDLHWTYFDRPTSKSLEPAPFAGTLALEQAYDVLGSDAHWTKGRAVYRLSLRRAGESDSGYLQGLQKRITDRRDRLVKNGLKSYLVLVAADYVIEFELWASDRAYHVNRTRFAADVLVPFQEHALRSYTPAEANLRYGEGANVTFGR